MPRSKVFCIGFNKTGTTSLEKFMLFHGFRSGDQASGERLMPDYVQNRWESLKYHVSTADFFQDLPFSAPNTYRHLDAAFPNSRFILTVRDSAETWYRSLLTFHKDIFGYGKRVPTREDLERAPYRFPGFAWLANRALYPSPPDDPYNREALIGAYEKHRKDVEEYFGERENLLVLEISDPEAPSRLGGFLDIVPQMKSLPWLNKSRTE